MGLRGVHIPCLAGPPDDALRARALRVLPSQRGKSRVLPQEAQATAQTQCTKTATQLKFTLFLGEEPSK